MSTYRCVLCHVCLVVFFLGLPAVMADCGAPTEIEGAIHNLTGSPPFPEGTAVSYSCTAGYNQAGTSRVSRCSNTGWVGADLECSEIFCPFRTHTVPRNGYIANTPTFTINSMIEFACNSGYTLVGQSLSRCLVDGRWTSQQPSCEAVTCGEFPGVANGEHHQEAPDGVYDDYGSVVRVLCNEGYIMSGDYQVLCGADGVWTEPPTCEPNTCTSYPPSISNCTLTSRLTTTAYYLYCVTSTESVSATRIGPTSTICMDGAWYDTNMACYCNCKLPEDLGHVTLHNVDANRFLAHGAVLDWTCNQGRVKATDHQLVCHDGHIEQPVCRMTTTTSTTTTTTTTQRPATTTMTTTQRPPATTTTASQRSPPTTTTTTMKHPAPSPTTPPSPPPTTTQRPPTTTTTTTTERPPTTRTTQRPPITTTTATQRHALSQTTTTQRPPTTTTATQRPQTTTTTTTQRPPPTTTTTTQRPPTTTTTTERHPITTTTTTTQRPPTKTTTTTTERPPTTTTTTTQRPPTTTTTTERPPTTTTTTTTQRPLTTTTTTTQRHPITTTTTTTQRPPTKTTTTTTEGPPTTATTTQRPPTTTTTTATTERPPTTTTTTTQRHPITTTTQRPPTTTTTQRAPTTTTTQRLPTTTATSTTQCPPNTTITTTTTQRPPTTTTTTTMAQRPPTTTTTTTTQGPALSTTAAITPRVVYKCNRVTHHLKTLNPTQKPKVRVIQRAQTFKNAASALRGSQAYITVLLATAVCVVTRLLGDVLVS